METKQLPTSKEAEEAVVGAVLLEKDAIQRVAGTLKPEHISTPHIADIYSACIDLFKESKPIDLLTVSTKLQELGTLEKAGGAYALVELTNKVASSAHLEEHTNIILQAWVRRATIQFAAQLQASAFDLTEDEIEALNKAEAEIDAIKQALQKGKQQSNQEIIEDVFAQMDRAAAGEKGVDLFGVKQVDKLLDGMENDLLIVAGRPGMGKSSLVNSAIKKCVLDGSSALFWSLEMTNTSTMFRLLSACTGIEHSRLKRRKITASEENDLMFWADKISQSNIILEQVAGVNILDIKARAVSAKRKHNISAVFIDRLELLNDLPHVAKDNKSSRVGANTKIMRQMAQNMNIPVVCLCQLNRKVEERQGKIPQLSDLRESGDIEQDATKILFLTRPEYYNIETDEEGNSMKGKAIAILAKNTHGATGAAICRFNAESMVFETDFETELNPF